MIEARELSKTYGSLKALDRVSLDIGQGEIVGLLGPNGAGKTTLIRILTGYFEPSGGTVTIDGVDVEANPLAVQRNIGYLPEHAALYPDMLVQEYLAMVAELRQVPESKRRSLMSEAIWATGLELHLTRPIAALSKGFRQRVGLAQAILHQPKLLILDEPTSGLDPTQVEHVRELIRRLSGSATVLFSTHILSEVEQVCKRAVILLGGRIEADARLDELQSTDEVVVGVAEDSADAAAVGAALERIEGVSGVERSVGRAGYTTWRVHGRVEPDMARSVYRVAREQGWDLGELRPLTRDLETVFRELVAKHRGLSASNGGQV